MRSMRKAGFFLKDLSDGRVILKNLREIRLIQADPFGFQAASRRNEMLESLVAIALANVPFYRELGVRDFSQLPVIQKSKISTDFSLFLSEQYAGKNLFKVSTSGSTGVPFLLYQNRAKRQRNTADVLYFMDQTGYELGNPLIELEVWRIHNKRSRLRNFLQNTLQIDVTQLDDHTIAQLLQVVSTTRGKKNILGLASALEAICQYMESGNIWMKNCDVAGITANSEYLNEFTRNTLEKRFGAPVFSRYSNEELGILAHQTEGSDGRFELNWSSYFFEILDMNHDSPAKEGEMGRLVVTDLFNHAMPVLRYDTGDIGMFDNGAEGHRYLQSVEGRKMDLVYDTRGNLLSSYVVYTLFYPYYHQLNQYQFIQTDPGGYLIKINPKGRFSYEQELIDAVRKEFGNDSAIQIEYVDEIPPLASGKRRKVVNLCQHI